MSVIVKGMDIPKSCFDCGLMQFDEMCDEYCAYVYGKDKHYLDNDVEKNRPELQYCHFGMMSLGQLYKARRILQNEVRKRRKRK